MVRADPASRDAGRDAGVHGRRRFLDLDPEPSPPSPRSGSSRYRKVLREGLGEACVLGYRPGAAADAGWAGSKPDPFHRDRVRMWARASGAPARAGDGRGFDVAGSAAASRPGSGRARPALPEDVQPLRRGRTPARPLRRLRALSGRAAARRRLPALRGPAPRGPCESAGPRRRPRPRAVSGMSRTTTPLRSGDWAVELRTAAQQPHPSHEVSPGARGGGRPRAAPRAGSGVPARLCGARRGDRNAHLAAAASPARIQPRGRAGRHRPPEAGTPAAAGGSHRPPPHPAPGEDGERGGAPCERRGRVQGSPLASGTPAGSNRGRRPDDRGDRIGAGGDAPDPGCRTDRDLVLRPDAARPSRLRVATHHPRIRGAALKLRNPAASARPHGTGRRGKQGSGRFLLSCLRGHATRGQTT